MPVSITIDTKKANQRFARLIRSLANPNEPMTVIAHRGINDVIDHFNKTEDPTSKWAPIKHRDGKPLNDTGTLRASTKWKKLSLTTVELFNRTHYGKYHQFGTKHIEVRKWMWISERAFQDMVKTMSRYVGGAF